MRHTNKGFTLIELLVVISVVNLLSSVTISAVKSAQTSTRNAQRLLNVDQIVKGFQIAITGGSGSFPSSGGQSRCLGKSTCWISLLTESATVNAVLSTGMTRPPSIDPFFKSTEFGDATIYNSNAFTLFSGSGAYLFWKMENQPSMSCGRGTITSIDAGSYQCGLYLGPPTP